MQLDLLIPVPLSSVLADAKESEIRAVLCVTSKDHPKINEHVRTKSEQFYCSEMNTEKHCTALFPETNGCGPWVMTRTSAHKRAFTKTSRCQWKAPLLESELRCAAQGAKVIKVESHPHSFHDTGNSQQGHTYTGKACF